MKDAHIIFDVSTIKWSTMIGQMKSATLKIRCHVEFYPKVTVVFVGVSSQHRNDIVLL